MRLGEVGARLVQGGLEGLLVVVLRGFVPGGLGVLRVATGDALQGLLDVHQGEGEVFQVAVGVVLEAFEGLFQEVPLASQAEELGARGC